MKKNILFFVFNLCVIGGLLLNLTSCNTTETPLPPDVTKPTLTLAIDNVSCTEVWLQLTTKDLTLPAELTLKQYNPTGDSVTQTFSLSTQDSLFYIDSLLPNQSYKFKVAANTTNNPQPTSNEVLAQTMDTTSHNFTWQTWEFGQHSSSVLYDVAIIDENNIWAVGEIYMNDSLGNPDPSPYNAVHWNGSSWEVKRIPTRTFSGTIVSSAIRTIYAFNGNDIWTFSIAGSYSHYISGSWVTEFVNERVGSGNKLWGTSSSNLYLVCTNGGISHYNGNTWTKIESGTTLHLYDIWGNFNNKTSKWEVIAVGANLGTGLNRIILSLSGDSGVTPLTTTEIIGSIHGIWFNKTSYYVVGNGVFTKKDIFSLSPWINLGDDLSDYFLGAIDGTENNNIITCGSYGELLHFNGVTWKSFQNMFSGILLGEVALKGNTVVTVGFNSTKAFICIGKNN
jgi:hypothetical protein